MGAKKRYTAPTLTALGGAVEKTRGRFGNRPEFISFFIFIG